MSEAVCNDIEVRAVCPVTKGLPVRMTEHGFALACAAALGQAREAAQGNSGLSLAAVRMSRCLQCRGQERPPELQVLDLEILKTERGSAQCKRELEMSGKKQDGTCENCGRKNMALTRLHGDLVCTSCGNLFGAMANRPEAVKKALRKMLPQFLPTEAGGEQERDLAQRCNELAAEVQGLNNQLADEQALRKKRDAVAGRLNEENTVLASRVSELEKRLEGLEEWEKVPALGIVSESGYEQDFVRDQLAVFALKVLQGQVGVVHREA
jgi:ribosomal protein L37AE/L43A